MRVRMMSYGLGLAACCIIASSCGSHEGYAGLTKTQAMNAAEAEIAKNDYGGNRAYFHGSIWSDAVRRTRTRLEIGRG
jgi:starvation-inducible outer membrane lipoprotein